MGIGLAFLITLTMVLVGPHTVTAAQVRCLACHQPHYTDQGGCVSCHRGNPHSSRKPLAHSGLIRARYAAFTDTHAQTLQNGKRLADRAACRRCHTMAGTGNKLALDLDSLLQTRTPEAIQIAIAKPAVFMPDFHFSEHDRDALVTAILAGGLTAKKNTAEPPLVVYFSVQSPGRKNIFAKQCGACHRMLSAREGGLGTGTNGPNLSGLLTPFYPQTFPNQLAWTAERLKRWLKNPREIRPETLMRPLTIPVAEWQPLLDNLQPAQKP